MSKGSLETNVKKKLRSILLPNKNGIILSSLGSEYYGMIGEYIPFRELGHPSLLRLLEQWSEDTVTLERLPGGQVLVRARADSSTKHIEELVLKQKYNPEGIM